MVHDQTKDVVAPPADQTGVSAVGFQNQAAHLMTAKTALKDVPKGNETKPVEVPNIFAQTCSTYRGETAQSQASDSRERPEETGIAGRLKAAFPQVVDNLKRDIGTIARHLADAGFIPPTEGEAKPSIPTPAVKMRGFAPHGFEREFSDMMGKLKQQFPDGSRLADLADFMIRDGFKLRGSGEGQHNEGGDPTRSIMPVKGPERLGPDGKWIPIQVPGVEVGQPVPPGHLTPDERKRLLDRLREGRPGTESPSDPPGTVRLDDPPGPDDGPAYRRWKMKQDLHNKSRERDRDKDGPVKSY